MKTLRFSLPLLTVTLLAMAFGSVASAQATRTWVSGVGDDANPCSRTAPCKTFPGAISKTAAGGEIDCLDPGGFGAVTITKSITIDCAGGEDGGILAPGTNAVNISANASTDTVTLRNMNIVQGLNGVQVNSAKAVHIVNLNIYGLSGSGVNVATSGTVFLTIEDTRIHDNGNGIVTNASAAGAVVAGDLNRVSIWNNNGSGINAQNGSRLQVHNSSVFSNSVGVNQTSLAGTGLTVTVYQSFFTNGTAFQSISGGSIGVSGCLLSQNGTVFNPNGGSISTASDNIAFGNGANGVANGPAVTKI